MINSAGTHLRCIGGERVEVWSSPDGPLLVRGVTMIIDEDGDEHLAERPVVALCRCGTSSDPPWCDGMHKLLQRRDRSRP